MIEVFAKLDDLGESAGEDHIFTGTKRDFMNAAKWLDEEYQNNKRKKSVLTLFTVFREKASMTEPYLRLSRKQTATFHQALKSLAETKKSAPLRKLVAALNVSLWVY